MAKYSPLDSAEKYGVSKIAIGNRSIAEAHRIQKTAPEVASANNNSSLLSQANIRQLEHQRWTALLMPKSPSPPYQQHHPSAPSSYEYISGETEMPPQHLSIQEGETALGFWPILWSPFEACCFKILEFFWSKFL